METHLLNIVGRIYDSALTRSNWHEVLNVIADLAGGEAANMLIISPKTGRADVISPRTDPDIIKGFFSGWASKDPTYGATVIFFRDRVVRAETADEMANFVQAFFEIIATEGAARVSKKLISSSPLPN